MGRTIKAVAAAAALMLLAACGKNAVADPPPTHSPISPATSSPTAPVMPALAKEHTKAGATAFVRFYWDTVNYARATLDETALAPLVDDHCEGCRGVRQSIIDDRTQQARVVGGTNHLVSASVTLTGVADGTEPWGANVRCQIESDAEVLDVPDGATDKAYPKQIHDVAMSLVIRAGNWIVDRLDPVQ